MKKIFAIAILFFCVIDAEAQRLDKIVERIDRIEKNKKFDNSLLTLDLTGKKFALIKNVNKVVYKNILEFSNDNNKVTLIELTDDKLTDAKTSKIYTGDALKKEFYVSVRADKLEGKNIDLPYTFNFVLQKRDGNLCLVNISNNEIWLDTDSGKK
jgi:hypothetical protein